jgi:hypothetical protein
MHGIVHLFARDGLETHGLHTPEYEFPTLTQSAIAPHMYVPTMQKFTHFPS